MLGKTEGRRRKGRQRARWLEGITDSMDTGVSKLQDTVKGMKTWCAAVRRVGHDLATEQQQSSNTHTCDKHAFCLAQDRHWELGLTLIAR